MSTAIDELLLATADVEIQATGKQPSVNIVAYTGGLMSVPGWGPVAIDLDGIDASADQVSILADHDSRLSGIIGHGKAIVASGKLLVQGTITIDRSIATGRRFGPRWISIPSLGRFVTNKLRASSA